MSRATELAEQLTQWTCNCIPAFKDRDLHDPECIHCMINPEATEAATILRQQDAALKLCIEALEDAHYTAERHQDVIKREAALAAAKGVL